MAAGWARRAGFHLATAVAVLVCLVAARWQWERAHRTEADAVPDVQAVALADFDPAQSYSGMRLSLAGRFDAEHQMLVAPRRRDGAAGAWLLTPLVPTPTARDPQPAAFLVVRGWVPDGGSVPIDPPAGIVRLVGVLVADERQADPQVGSGEPPVVRNVDSGAMQLWAGYPVRAGWLALQSIDPAGEGQPIPLGVGELPGADVGLNWRNAAYAIQWVVFGGFAIFFWNRFRRDYFGPASGQGREPAGQPGQDEQRARR